MYARVLSLVVPTLLSTVAGCAVQPQEEDELTSESNGTGDLSLGQVDNELGSWGDATKCKPIPKVEALKTPEITISLDGLTLHLRDRDGTYDRVFAVGPGALEGGTSKTPIGLFHTGSDTTETKDGGWGYYYPCKVWWTDPDTNKQSPVFAGLPFIRLSGTPTAGYALHGPIDGYPAPNGGSLRRGYVSHGCVRMAAADIVEVYARIRGKARVPVRIQQEVERQASGLSVDVPSRFVGAECKETTDCNFAGGVCHEGTCTLACTHGCPDRAGEAPTFCAPSGFCMPQASSTFNASCARYEGRLALTTSVSRPDRSARADVCAPR
ncbi:MAG: L,D-transpeptidase [Polyangiales bacterium]